MQNRKVLHIIDNMGFGGAQTFVKDLFEAQEDNPNIFLFVLRNKEPQIHVNHKNIFLYPSAAKLSFGPLVDLSRLIQQEDIEIVHCHLFRSEFFGWVLKRFYFKSLRIVFHEHSGIVEDAFYYRLFLRMTKKSIDLFIAVSVHMSRMLQKNAFVSQDKITVLHNFVNLRRFSIMPAFDRPLEREKLGINDDAFVVGFAGRLVAMKGWRHFIDAAQIVSASHRDVKFLIAGDGPDREEMMLYLKEVNLRNIVIYAGYVSNMTWFYSIVDCLVMCSLREGLPMTQLEALAMGVPLVTSNAPGMNEIGEDEITCLYTVPQDPHDTAKKIDRLIMDHELQQKLKTNGPILAKQYDVDDFIKSLNQIYETEFAV
jgi:glycosyltransferase involved in cell wall biosynthesis